MIVLLWLTIVACGLLTAGVVLYFGYQVLFRSTTLLGPVFVPSADDRLDQMLHIAQIAGRASLIDLGSGDGKVVMALAKQFPRAHITGVELNPFLVRRSRKAVQNAGLERRITIRRQSFWQTDLSRYDVVFLYGTSYIMLKLEKKARSEMRPGTQLVSNYFQFPSLQPTKSIGVVHLYQF
jgi:predicted O-methyltransferase YrrM